MSLPKGGGAVRGLDEKLLVSQATGAASLSVPVYTSPARGGSGGPALALSYQSSNGNGPFGLGWQLPIPAISRKTATGVPRYDDAADSDTFALAGAEDLVPALRPSGDGWVEDSFDLPGPGGPRVRRYRPRIEGGFARIERLRDPAAGSVHWRTVGADNLTSVYGPGAGSRIADPADGDRVFSWLLDHSYDDRGNVVAYEYKAENREEVPASAGEAGREVAANRYLKRIRYGNRVPYHAGDPALPQDWLFEVVFDYGEHDPDAPAPEEAAPWSPRPDPFSSYRSGFEIRTHRLCRRILMFHRMPELGEEPVLVRSTDLAYAHDEAPADPSLPAYSLLAAVTQTGWVRKAGGYESARLPPLELEYSPLALDDTQRFAPAESLENVPGSMAMTRQRLTDLEGEGLPGVLTETAAAWYYKRNVSAWDPAGGPPSARFEPLAEVALKPSGVATQLRDLDGDGRLEAVSLAPPLAGRFERDGEGWGPFRPFAEAAAISWSSPDLRLVDLDGDGRPDVLLAGEETLSSYRWNGEGFAAADTEPRPADGRGPAPAPSLRDGSILMADMSGDGLADLVRVGNGEVCYWPSLGHGRFGAKVVMDGAPMFEPPERFEASRVRLADVDGSGPADLIYLGERTRVWLNRSGGSWAEGREIRGVPSADACAEAEVVDFLGTGTACIVWTGASPADAPAPLRYVDLTAASKPHLLTRVRNNLGAERELTYAPSTRSYVRDAARNEPWITRLPFPVHVVERVETTEAISGTRLVSTYSYHHGHYDGLEREFRGFARVEQTDAETIPTGAGPSALPPVRTKTWFHTGYWDEREALTERLRGEFYAAPDAPQLGPGALPAGGDGEELREACRALRGSVLRQEVYAEDGSAAAAHPYTTSEHRYDVRRIQPPREGRCGSFHAWEREQLSCHHERDAAEPRIGHSMTLAIDDFGAVTRAAGAAYGRPSGGLAQQEETLLTYEESDLLNVAEKPDWYRLGLPLEHRGYELTGFSPDPATGRFDPDALAPVAAAATEIPPEATAPIGTPRRRLLSRRRLIYRSDDLSHPLPFGEVESLALLDRSHTLRCTKGQLAPFAARLGGPAALAALLSGDGGLADLDGSGDWWAPSSRAFFSPDPDAPDPAFARAHFYLPQGARDPWSNLSRIAYDSHDLLPESSTDAAGNTVEAANNYRLLRPWLITDANRNRSGVRCDALGMVVATAAMGKLLPDGGDEGDHLDTTTAEPAAGDDPTTKLSYDLDAFRAWATDPGHDPDHPAPTWTHTMARVRHKDPATPWTESYAYGDGLGRTALVKALAEGGPAPVRDAAGKLERDAEGHLVLAPAPLRWVGSGRSVYDNKGNVVKAYEPFFDSSPAFTAEPDLVELGVATVTRFDPLSRPVRIDNPDGSFRTAAFGPWEQVESDEDDNCKASDWYAARAGGGLGADQQEAAAKAAAHDGTPTRAQSDPLGRAFRTLHDDGSALLATTSTLDVEGRLRALTDALGRTALTKEYDLGGGELHQSTPDGGERWLLADAAGQPLVAWDSRGNQVRHRYDELRRPTDLEVRSDSAPPRIAQRIEYGEALGEAAAIAANLRGAAHLHRDEAAVTTTARRDFDGNVVESSSQLIADEGPEVDWASPPALDPEAFVTRTGFDALGRATAATAPDGSTSASTYNERGLLTGVSVSVHGSEPPRQVLAAVAYDAKGQRTETRYGNGVTVRSSYDPETWRLARVLTTRQGSGEALQDLAYTYDPVGNVTRTGDAAKPATIFAGQLVTAGGDYDYDALYRLTRAGGREHRGLAGASAPGADDAARTVTHLPADMQALRNYSEAYVHDEVGNLRSVAHTAAGGSWTRTYAYDGIAGAAGNNRLGSTTVGSLTERYEYDAHGNLTSIPHLSQVEWDWKDQLRTTATRVVGTGDPETTRYRYDADGARIRKTVVGAGGRRTAQRLYLGPYELYREYGADGSVTVERQSLHVADGACLLETTTRDAGAGAVLGTLARYQHGDRLGSSVLELDDAGAVITYEEFHPYGSTALLAGRSAAEVSLKRYRYLGRERDRETGFNFQGARYYAPWLGRWISADPAGLLDGAGRYTYARSNPVTLSDPGGRQSTDPPSGGITVVGGTFEMTPSTPGPGAGTPLWLFFQGPFGADARATPAGRGGYEGMGEDFTAMARWWGYYGKVDRGHFDQPFWSTKAGDITLMVPQPMSDNRSQGALVERPAAALARAAGEDTRYRGRDLTAPANLPPAPQPSRPSLYLDPKFLAMKPGLLAGDSFKPPPNEYPALSLETGAAPTSTAGADTGWVQQELQFDTGTPRSPATASGSPGGSTQTGGGGGGGGGGSRGGGGGSGGGGALLRSAPRGGGGPRPPAGFGSPAGAGVGRSLAGANPVIPGADLAEQFFSDLANTSRNPLIATAAGAAAMATAVVASAAASGAVAGNATELVSRKAGASPAVAVKNGALASMVAGAWVGAAIAAPSGPLDPVGAGVGALVGLGAYLLTR
ncbi:MAG TPA: SpvB/TcaC N-terminal domain-containing protein [Solirubrobacterales bacterium]